MDGRGCAGEGGGRPNPCLISVRDRGSRSSRCDRVSGSSRGRGKGSRGKVYGRQRGRGPHARPEVVPTTGLHHRWTGRGMEKTDKGFPLRRCSSERRI